MVPGAGHAGRPGLQEAVRVRRGPENQEVHTDIPSLHEDMGRGSAEGVHAAVEAPTRQERQEFPDKRGRRERVQLGP